MYNYRHDKAETYLIYRVNAGVFKIIDNARYKVFISKHFFEIIKTGKLRLRNSIPVHETVINGKNYRQRHNKNINSNRQE